MANKFINAIMTSEFGAEEKPSAGTAILALPVAAGIIYMMRNHILPKKGDANKDDAGDIDLFMTDELGLADRDDSMTYEEFHEAARYDANEQEPFLQTLRDDIWGQ